MPVMNLAGPVQAFVEPILPQASVCPGMSHHVHTSTSSKVLTSPSKDLSETFCSSETSTYRLVAYLRTAFSLGTSHIRAGLQGIHAVSGRQVGCCLLQCCLLTLVRAAG